MGLVSALDLGSGKGKAMGGSEASWSDSKRRPEGVGEEPGKEESIPLRGLGAGWCAATSASSRSHSSGRSSGMIVPSGAGAISPANGSSTESGVSWEGEEDLRGGLAMPDRIEKSRIVEGQGRVKTSSVVCGHFNDESIFQLEKGWHNRRFPKKIDCKESTLPYLLPHPPPHING